MEEQTSTPWKVSLRGGFNILGQGGYAVASTRGAIIVPVGECLANAQFIVRAVNSHVYLVEACQAAIPVLQSYNEQAFVIQQLKDAIARATGGE